MTNSDDELEAFKRLPINFAAASFGYRIIKKKSSRHSAVMVGKNGHKIICSTARHDGHGVFFSTDGTTSGSIIDLVQYVTGGNLGVVRQALRPLLYSNGLPEDIENAGWQLQPTKIDFLGVLARFSNFDPITSKHPYLCDTRQIPSSILLNTRFSGRIFHDPDNGNAVFPNWGTPDGSKDRCLVGYSIKNKELSMFSKGGKKGLWPSNIFEDDTELVISEAAIDALSYACLKVKTKFTRYVTTGGQLNPEQPALIQSAIDKLPEGGTVTIAVDNDEGGDQLTNTLTRAFKATNRNDLSLRVDVPKIRGFDWNSVLTSKHEPC